MCVHTCFSKSWHQLSASDLSILALKFSVSVHVIILSILAPYASLYLSLSFPPPLTPSLPQPNGGASSPPPASRPAGHSPGTLTSSWSSSTQPPSSYQYVQRVCMYVCADLSVCIVLAYHTVAQSEILSTECEDSNLSIATHILRHAFNNVHVYKSLGIFLENSHSGLNWGPLTLAVSALPPELWPPGDSQPSQFSLSLCMCRQNPVRH